MIEECDHEYEHTLTEQVDRSTIVNYYNCVKCDKEISDYEDEPLRVDDLEDE